MAYIGANEYEIEQQRRIDLMINNAAFQIPIEVKFYAGDQEGQCYDYFRYAKNAKLVYLTIQEDVPSKQSRHKGTGELSKDQIQCISWTVDIVQWLCSLLDQMKNPIKAMVMQYIDAIAAIADVKEQEMKDQLYQPCFNQQTLLKQA